MELEVNKRYSRIFVVLFFLAGAVDAAPLDALLSADQYRKAGEFHADASYDAMNSTLDVLNIRGKDTLYAGTNVGDYSGLHLRAGYALTDRLSVEGGAWQRKITYRSDNETLQSWQSALQYRLNGNQKSRSLYALRLSVWGNQAGSLTKASPTTFVGKSVNNVTINSPRDIQEQIDLVGSWRLTRKTTASAFAGLGRSTVSTGNMSANYTSGNGCNYNLAFTATTTSGVLAAPCAAPGIILTSFSTPQGLIQEFSYHANYYQLGGMLHWQHARWDLRGGYQFQYLNRSNVDSLIVSRGGTSYQTNHVLVADVSRKITPHVAVFARGQMMSNQFVGEIPFAYNSVTASKFSRKYGIASFGVTMNF